MSLFKQCIKPSRAVGKVSLFTIFLTAIFGFPFILYLIIIHKMISIKYIKVDNNEIIPSESTKNPIIYYGWHQNHFLSWLLARYEKNFEGVLWTAHDKFNAL